MTEDGSDSRLAKAIGALSPRSIGPALMGGRIADIAIHDADRARWFVAVGSGGVWRTDNAGITWKPLFDDQPSYSIGCVTIDPSLPTRVWVGTGEAVSGRHVGYGDGVYRSDDAGESWTRVGLDHSEHISEILVDPRDGDVVYVAAEGPLWSSGGERGLYKSTDAGETWDLVLGIDDDTGVTSIAFAPDDPDTVYAATYQRRRRVWSFLGGGPGSGIHVSNDAGVTWQRMSKGLPETNMGRIGLATTPADPSLVYATIEAAEKKDQGFYRSTDRGRTWERRNEYVSGGTGGHYYQEIFASPTDAGRVYQVDVFLHATSDGGKTFNRLETARNKHSDNHVVWIDPTDSRHLIVGCDAGLYETWDDCVEFRHVSNLPISQFYRVAVDNDLPFTSVLGGAQDLGTLFGPTRTQNVDGVRNRDWQVWLGADGYHAAFDPNDNDVSYLTWQVGNLLRHDRRTMELVDIRPVPAPDDPAERWNWDAPFVTSRHVEGRLYLASHRVWRSDDRGDSWTPISDDLTGGQNRYELAVADRVESVDALWDHMAMSQYATITALAESPLVDGLLWAGTDDGRIQVTEDGGETWREAARPEGLAEVGFINCVAPSWHEPDTVFVAADDHKSGDYRPQLWVSRDRGQRWESLASGLPERSLVWAIEQDHEAADLLFVGAEHGMHVSRDGGRSWHRLGKDVPTIAFRHLALQRRDGDLVGGSFGRGIWVLDDYAVLRELDEQVLDEPAALFGVRDAWWYEPHLTAQAAGQPTLGSTAFRTENPPFGAVFTYHLRDEVRSAKEQRRETEKALDDATDVPFPGWDVLRAEAGEPAPLLQLVIRNAEGDPVRAITAETKAGLHRTAWDLRHAPAEKVTLAEPEFREPWQLPPRGPLAAPGTYSVELALVTEDGIEVLAGPQHFEVVPVPGPVDDSNAAVEFRQETAAVVRRVSGAVATVEALRDRLAHVRAGVLATPSAVELLTRVDDAGRRLDALVVSLAGDPVRARLSEPDRTSIKGLAERVADEHWATTAPPTATQRAAIAQASVGLETATADLSELTTEVASLSTDLDAAGGPWTPR